MTLSDTTFYKALDDYDAREEEINKLMDEYPELNYMEAGICIDEERKKNREEAKIERGGY